MTSVNSINTTVNVNFSVQEEGLSLLAHAAEIKRTAEAASHAFASQPADQSHGIKRDRDGDSEEVKRAWLSSSLKVKKIRSNNGIVYEGQMLNRRPHGSGIKKFPDGRSYAGDWQNGLPHGEGVFANKDGATFEGSWINGKRQGLGRITYPDGTVFIGYYENNVRKGYGRFIGREGTVIHEGIW